MSGVVVAMVGYRCRVCGTPMQVGVSPVDVDGERHLCAQNHRLYRGRCDECDEERTHVLDAPGVDAPRPGLPIDDLVLEDGDRP